MDSTIYCGMVSIISIPVRWVISWGFGYSGTLQAYNEMNYFMNWWVGTRCYSVITQFGPLNPAFELVLTINPRQGLTCGDVAELSLVGG